jgi:hypothetical protein
MYHFSHPPIVERLRAIRSEKGSRSDNSDNDSVSKKAANKKKDKKI